MYEERHRHLFIDGHIEDCEPLCARCGWHDGKLSGQGREAARAAEKEKEEEKRKREREKAERAGEWALAVALCTGLKPKDIKAAVEGVLKVAVYHVKKSGSFKLAGMLKI